MRVLCLCSAGKFQVQEIDKSNTSSALRSRVGGWLEHLQINQDVHMWLNEEGKLIGLPRNELATYICQFMERPIAKTDFIAGSVVFTGVDAQGDTVACPQSWIDMLFIDFPQQFVC